MLLGWILTLTDISRKVLRGDVPRLGRATSIVTESKGSPNKRSKPLKYAYEKEIVLYAHHKKLDYFSTECIYSPEAFRGSARTLIKNMERIRPSAILDVVKSGEDMAKLVPLGLAGTSSCQGPQAHVVVGANEGEEMGGCGSANGRSSGGEMAEMEKQLGADDRAAGTETEITLASVQDAARVGLKSDGTVPVALATQTTPTPQGQRHDRHKGIKSGRRTTNVAPNQTGPKSHAGPRMGQCARCGYLSSQAICKACTLLEGLNKSRPKMQIEVGLDDEDASQSLRRGLERVVLTGK